MSPRSYNLGARAASVEETKKRIVVAATEEFAEQGIEGASMASIARRADVAPGTVRYHFESVDGLAEAVVGSWIDDIGMPDPAVVDPQAPVEERLRALITTLFDLFERSEWAYETWRQNTDHPAYVAAADAFYAIVGEMLGRAAGVHASDPMVPAVLSVLSDPGFRGTLIGRGLSSEQAIEVAVDLGVAWLSTRS
ncbi:MAG: TetR/AcrR family transcriptional regulator [Acidimicrobiia bacterium]